MLAEPKCYTRHCKHYLGVRWLREDESSEVNVCPAFPDGIPGAIAYGDVLHLTVFPGQIGDTLFEEGPFEWEQEEE